jgi:hypothetical protein
MRRVLFAVVLVAAGCGDLAPTDAIEAPLLAGDQADRGCAVVLRELQRNAVDPISYETSGSSWVWSGIVEVAAAAVAEGDAPAVLFRWGATSPWREAAGTPLDGGATPGYARFAIRLDHDLVGPGMSATAITTARIEVVPFLRRADGSRLFDHNRHPGELDNYVMTYPDFAIGRAPAVCAAPASGQHANLVFAADFTARREGVITAGGTLSILYDVARLATCRYTQGGLPRWDITAWVRFDTGQLISASVRDAAATFIVPTDGARSVEVWFESTSVSGCHAWDSNFGANYRFDLARAPRWIGEARTRLSRDTGDACDGGIPAQHGFTFDTWTRQRAAITNLCFEVYEPGVTDRDDPQLWQKLDAAIRYRLVGETAWHVVPAPLESRRGNNARYATSWRGLDPFRPYHCPEVPPAPSSDPQYRELAIEYVIVVNGGELRPAPGAAFIGTFLDYEADEACP